MRHVPFPITLDMRNRWLRHMMDALDSLDLPEAHAMAMRDYFVRAADMLVNTAEQPESTADQPGGTAEQPAP